MFGMMGVFAEFERSMIVARVNAGMARARVNGTKSGRALGRPRITRKVEQRIRHAMDAHFALEADPGLMRPRAGQAIANRPFKGMSARGQPSAKAGMSIRSSISLSCKIRSKVTVSFSTGAAVGAQTGAARRQSRANGGLPIYPARSRCSMRRTRIVVTALALPADEKVRAGEGASNPGLYWEATRLKSPLFSPLS